jgi:hypothetical protein
MQKIINVMIALLSGFAVIGQFWLNWSTSDKTLVETLIRFFSYFTILTNILVAVFFTGRIFRSGFTYRAGNLTALTVYIFVVGIVYQVLLRHLWNPVGFQRLVDELLHSVIPPLVIFYWYRYGEKAEVRYSQVKNWMIYPLSYFAFVLIRGSLSGYYPYPFVDVAKIGLPETLWNGALLITFFLLVSFFFIRIGKKLQANR